MLDRATGRTIAEAPSRPDAMACATRAADDFDREREVELEAARLMTITPWNPVTDPQENAVLGKFLEEVSELGAILARIKIQGADGIHPVTGKPNLAALMEEVADVTAQAELASGFYGLDANAIRTRVERKKNLMRLWHGLMRWGAHRIGG